VDFRFGSYVLITGHWEQYYIEPDHLRSDRFWIKGGEAKHIHRVMRKKAGDWLRAVDGQGGLYEGPILNIDESSVEVSIERESFMVHEPGLHLTLAQAMLKGSGFDWVVEKGTEIGISRFVPLITQRSVVTRGRQERWQKKALAAMKQSTRSRCPEIAEPQSFDDFVTAPLEGGLFIAHDRDLGANPDDLISLLEQQSHALLIVGPEGGFSEKEVTLAIEQGYKLLRMGDRRLRSDTAGLVGAVKLLSAVGDLS
jgi:16S rRNA (uracil1498-N3)-methyltransferase